MWHLCVCVHGYVWVSNRLDRRTIRKRGLEVSTAVCLFVSDCGVPRGRRAGELGLLFACSDRKCLNDLSQEAACDEVCCRLSVSSRGALFGSEGILPLLRSFEFLQF